MTEHEGRILALLTNLYPGWRYALTDTPGLPRWWACRYRPPSDAQRAAGAREVIGRCTGEGLAVALAVQSEITHRVRTWSYGSSHDRDG